MANLNLKTDSPISRRIVRAFLEFLDSGHLSRSLSLSVSASINLILCLDCEFLFIDFACSLMKFAVVVQVFLCFECN